MELKRNMKLNGMELYVTEAEKKQNDEAIKKLGWYWSTRKEHYWQKYSTKLWEETVRLFPESRAVKKAEVKEDKPVKKAEPKKAEPKKTEPKETVKVTEHPIEGEHFDISMAGFKPDPKIGVDELKVWKSAVMHCVEKILDEAIASLIIE